jgi:hypothetical protein
MMTKQLTKMGAHVCGLFSSSSVDSSAHHLGFLALETVSSLLELALRKLEQLTSITPADQAHLRVVVLEVNPSTCIVLPCVSAPSGCASQQLSIIDCEYAGLIDPAIWVAEALVHMCWLDWGICTESEFPFSADHCAWHCEQYVALRSERGDPVDANFLQRVHLLRDALIVKFLLLKIMLYCTNMGSSGPSDTRDKHAAAAERDAGVAPGQMGRGELPGGSTDQLRKTLTVYYHMACAIET